ncbi:MAG: RodZ domain-containing protein [Catenulispora sp.]
MGGQRAEDERDGAGVGLDEADALRGEQFAGNQAGGAGAGSGVGARTAARAGDDAAEAVAAGMNAPVQRPVDGDRGGSAAGAETSVIGAGDSLAKSEWAPSQVADMTDSQVLGHRLFLARQHAGLAIEDVAAFTRIRPGMVREIEAGDFWHCGGDFYARGHVRAIAKCVGVDPEPLLAEHPPVVPAEPPMRPRAVAHAEPASAGVPTGAARDNAARFAARVPSRVIRPAAEGATLGAAAGKGFRKDDPGKIERQSKSANWTAAMLVALLGLVVFAGVQLIGGDGDKSAAAAAVPPPAAPKPVAVKPAAPVIPPPPKDVEVKIAAIGAASWLHVTGPDGRVLFDNLLPAGGTQSFKDPQQLGVTVGNASAVHMNLNGRDLGAAGGSGQVVHVTLKPTGAVTG